MERTLFTVSSCSRHTSPFGVDRCPAPPPLICPRCFLYLNAVAFSPVSHQSLKMQPDVSCGPPCLPPRWAGVPKSLPVVLLGLTSICLWIRLSAPQAGSQKRVHNSLFPGPGQEVGLWGVDSEWYRVTVRWRARVAGRVVPGKVWQMLARQREWPARLEGSDFNPPRLRFPPVCLAPVPCGPSRSDTAPQPQGACLLPFGSHLQPGLAGAAGTATHTAANRGTYSSAWRLEGQDQGARRWVSSGPHSLACRWRPVDAFSHGHPSVCAHAWCLSVCPTLSL